MLCNGAIKPASGTYDTPHKASQRKKQLNAIIKSDTKTVLILPSEEYLEVPLLLASGIKEENIYAVDWSRQVLYSKESKKYPKLNKLCMDVREAVSTIHAKGIKLDAANMDTCGTWCLSNNNRLIKIRDSGVFSNGARISITQSVGHISPDQMAIRDSRFKVETTNRALYAANIFGGQVVETGEYRNKGRGPTMQWVVVQL